MTGSQSSFGSVVSSAVPDSASSAQLSTAQPRGEEPEPYSALIRFETSRWLKSIIDEKINVNINNGLMIGSEEAYIWTIDGEEASAASEWGEAHHSSRQLQVLTILAMFEVLAFSAITRLSLAKTIIALIGPHYLCWPLKQLQLSIANKRSKERTGL